MKLVEAHRLDSIADYALRDDAPLPQPGVGEIRIEVACCGVGYVDALVSLGRYQVKPPLPHVPGQEAAGRVAAIGEGVAGFAIGDRVMATVGGGFAEQAIAPVDACWKIPPRMRFAQAAAFRLNYLTALHGLRDRGRLAAGEQLLVLGAAGGVGLAAVQVGRALGARVIAAGSSEDKRAFARAHGADATIDTAPEGWRDRLKAACGGRGPDVVFDPVCGPLFEPAFRSLAWNGRHLVVGFVGGPIPALKANLTLLKGAALVGVDVRQFGLLERAKADDEVRELLGWVEQGRLDPPVGRRFAFGDWRDALEFAMSGQAIGKAMLVVNPEMGE